MNDKKLAGIILAAGKGKRMKLKGMNKVALLLGSKPMISHSVSLLKSMDIDPIVVVIGYAKRSVIDILGDNVVFAEQKKRLGTAHATSCGLKKLPSFIQDVLVMQGDDSAFYTAGVIKKLINRHFKSNSSITMLTLKEDDPSGLGRIVRNKNDRIIAVVEEKDATFGIKAIHEINPACYVFKIHFLKKYLPQVKKSKVTGEYYLTSLIDIAVENNDKIEGVYMGNIAWRGVNTQEELTRAQEMFPEVLYE